MTQSIALASKFQPILDEIYQREALTAFLDSQTKTLDHSAANEVKVFKTSLVGLGDYSRASGYPSGDVTGTWETIKLEQERGRAFSVDAMDDEESLGMAFGTLASEFIRTQVAPEVDAYRFAKWAGASGISTVTAATLSTASAVLAAVDAASLQLDEDQVPSEGRVLFVSSTIGRLLDGALTRSLGNETAAQRRLQVLDDMRIIRVPQSRFYTQVTLDAGATSTAGGYAKTDSTGADINFILMHPTAVGQAKKHEKVKIFSPDVNQTSDGYLFQYRLYHDAWVYDNKVDGIYLHKKAAG
jgi:hypothetical protein